MKIRWKNYDRRFARWHPIEYFEKFESKQNNVKDFDNDTAQTILRAESKI